ncbi:hypothetical protein [Horticoccus sp. 23ND18S-11]|uniref:hypothetical protein n=1 Tax=Horticoccus sp. 23ND18S-11 TaxID=3391832 RepID=UPI0039C90551
MRTPTWPALLFASVIVINAAIAAAPLERAGAAFELPRLKARGNPDDPDVMARAKATVDLLEPGTNFHAQRVTSGTLAYLAVVGGKSWSRPLRGGPRDTTFVSFLAYGSTDTVIDVAGARLRIRAGATPGQAQLQVGYRAASGLTWINTGGPIRFEVHGGRNLAALPVLTLRLDRHAGVWDLYVARRLVLTDRPLGPLPKGAPNQFTVFAGAEGALVSGLVSADENPLWEDENGNGIDDDFEQRQRGALLPRGAASGVDRTRLAQQWQQDPQHRRLQPWPVQRPLPDTARGAAAVTAVKNAD